MNKRDGRAACADGNATEADVDARTDGDGQRDSHA
jgi:hypothetical protein